MAIILVSGLFNPAKMLAFLDLFGNWDPSLALVMAGAIAIGVPAFALAFTVSMVAGMLVFELIERATEAGGGTQSAAGPQ